MKNFNFIIALVAAVLCAVSCGIRLWLSYDILALACYAAIIAALPFSILLHELGHTVFGAAVKIKAVPKFSFTGSSSCKIIPKTDKKLRQRLIFTAFGGIVVNTLFIILGIVAIFVEVIPAWLCVFLPANVYLVLLNGLPDVLSGGKTDGLVIQELIRNTNEARVTLAVLTVQAQILGGKKIMEIDKALLFDLPVIQEDDAGFIALTQLRYEYFKACGDEEQSQKYLSRLDSLKQYIE